MKDRRAASLRFTLVASAVALALLSNYLLRDGDLRWAVTPLVIAVACLALASVRPSRGSSIKSAESTRSNRPMVHTGPDAGDPDATFALEFNESFFGAAAGVVSAVLMFVSLRNFGHDERDSLTLAWYCFGSAVVLALAAIPAIDGRWTGLIDRLRAAGGVRIGLRAMAPWLVLAAILVLGAGIRLYDLGDLPAGLWYDEADNLVRAREYAQDPGETPVYAPSTNLPTMFLLPVAAIAKLAGVSTTTGRLVAAGFGVLGVVATFLLVRQVLGTSTGMIAAFLVAVMRWDIIWSRIGMHGITAVLFAALTAWLTLRAVRTGRPSDYAFAGASLGLGMWFYTSFRMFPLVLAFILFHHLLVNRPAIRGVVARVALMVLVALFVAAPVVLFAMDNPDQFFDRTRTTSVFSMTPRDQWAGQIGTGLARHGLMFSREGDPNPRHNLPNAPMLDFITGSLFLLGFLFALTRWRDVTMLSLPVWVFFMVLPGVLTVPWEAPQSLRSIAVVPAVAALAALVIERLWSVAREAPWAPVRRLAFPSGRWPAGNDRLRQRRLLLWSTGQRPQGVRFVLDGPDPHGP